MTKVIIPANARSWIPGADKSDFPIQNLPYCCKFEEQDDLCVRISDQIVNLRVLSGAGLFGEESIVEMGGDFFAMTEPEDRANVRRILFHLFRADEESVLRKDEALQRAAFTPISKATLTLPVYTRQFVDFYSGIHHASNVGKMFRPDMPPLLPNYRHVPVAYNGRASSVVVDGTEIVRPNGQTKVGEDVHFGPTKELDFELEMGFYTAGQNLMGVPIPIEEVEEHILGIVLLNDWSARDMQRWEYQPLGPFLAKSFATTVSPYIIPLDALEPFRVKGIPQEPAVLPYLNDADPRAYDIHLEVLLQTPRMAEPLVISTSNSRHLYWSFRQQLAHQVSNGTPIESGDLYGTGTISGPDDGTYGSLLELTWRGANPLKLDGGDERTFLEDGDELTIRGWCQGDGYRIGFGECRGRILPASTNP